jgi:hypothetical protein
LSAGKTGLLHRSAVSSPEEFFGPLPNFFAVRQGDFLRSKSVAFFFETGNRPCSSVFSQFFEAQICRRVDNFSAARGAKNVTGFFCEIILLRGSASKNSPLSFFPEFCPGVIPLRPSPSL